MRLDGTSTEAMMASKYGTNYPDHIEGTSGSDSIWGFAGDDEIYGFGGVDWIFGGDGNDQIFGSYGADYLFGGANNDTIIGDDNFPGWGGADHLEGESGNDVLIGGEFADSLVGGSGRDIFAYYNYFYNPSSPSNPDVIWDFEDHAPASTIATDRIAVMGPAGTAANYKEFTIGYNNGYGLAQDFADYYIHKGADYVFVTDSVNGYLFADITDSDAIEMGFILMGLNDVSDFNYSNIVNVDNYNDNLYLNVNVYDFL
jgi:Ca2+-binding RTX toxin-like protein